MSFNSTGGLSDVRISCLPASCRWLKILKNAFCVPVFPVNSWMSSMISTSIIW